MVTNALVPTGDYVYKAETTLKIFMSDVCSEPLYRECNYYNSKWVPVALH